ncbi:MAG: ParB N-terminal domain-containing protein [Chloroflexi bacterium]|nr:ParB N-terminal domain-containing protein [Chloroflexota bacterium]
MTIELIPLNNIRRDGGTQSRASMNPQTIVEYQDALVEARGQECATAKGWPFPPVTVYYDGTDYHLSDGYHRTIAAAAEGWFQIPCDVRQGTRRDAVLASVAANADHGLRRNQADKRRAIETLLRDDEWGQWSDREIARRTNTTHPTVAVIRAEVEKLTGKFTSERRYTDRHGNETTMQKAQPKADSTDYAIAYDWLDGYQDEKGRRWYDLETNQVIHANSPCYQAFVAEFPDIADPKQYLKDSLDRLQRARRDEQDRETNQRIDACEAAMRGYATTPSLMDELLDNPHKCAPNFDPDNRFHAATIIVAVSRIRDERKKAHPSTGIFEQHDVKVAECVAAIRAAAIADWGMIKILDNPLAHRRVFDPYQHYNNHIVLSAVEVLRKERQTLQTPAVDLTPVPQAADPVLKALPVKPEKCPKCKAPLANIETRTLGDRADLDASCANCGTEHHWFSFFGKTEWTYAYSREPKPPVGQLMADRAAAGSRDAAAKAAAEMTAADLPPASRIILRNDNGEATDSGLRESYTDKTGTTYHRLTVTNGHGHTQHTFQPATPTAESEDTAIRDELFAVRQTTTRLAATLSVDAVGVGCIAALAQAMTNLDKALSAYEKHQASLAD